MSKSPRRRAIKSLDLERKKYRKGLVINKASFDAQLAFIRKDYERELIYLREDFRPHLAKLAMVRIGVPFRVPVMPEIGSSRIESADVDVPVYEVLTVDTHPDVIVEYAFPGDLIRYMGDGHETAIVREMGHVLRYVVESKLREVLGIDRRGQRR